VGVVALLLLCGAVKLVRCSYVGAKYRKPVGQMPDGHGDGKGWGVQLQALKPRVSGYNAPAYDQGHDGGHYDDDEEHDDEYDDEEYEDEHI